LVLAKADATLLDGAASRPVLGIFIGWRAFALRAGSRRDHLLRAQGGRKAGATRVSTGSVRELLGRLRHFAITAS
jgi:hypothetical protein